MLVKTEKLCRICLRKHIEKKCSNAKVCGVDGCPYFHHPKLHKNKDSDQEKGHVEKAVVNSHTNSSVEGLLFKIIPVKLHHKGKTVQTYALLDDGSSVTLVEQWIADYLNVGGIADELCLKWTGNTHKTEPNSMRISLEISGTGSQKHILQNARTVMSLNLPYQSISAEALSQQYDHLKDIFIESYHKKQPSLLIGLDNVKLTTSLKMKEGDSFEPVAAKTRLGWVVFGGASSSRDTQSYHTCSCQNLLDLEVDRALKSFIAIENLLVESPRNNLVSTEDERALNIMKSTIKYVGNRFEIGLVWRFEDFTVPDSYSMAFKRLLCLERVLRKDEFLKNNLKEQINEYVSKGYE